jgi:hypothetical protein
MLQRMRASLRRCIAALALAATAAVPVASVESCGGGGGSSAVATSGAGAGTATTAASAGGATSTIGVFVGSAGGGTTGTCGGPPPSDAGDDGPTGCEGLDGGVGFDAVAPLLVGCFGEACHNPNWTQPSFVNVHAYECCDGRLLVRPNDPARSYLIEKLEGHDICQGNRMPGNGPPFLSDGDVLTIREWICSGAPP